MRVLFEAWHVSQREAWSEVLRCKWSSSETNLNSWPQMCWPSFSDKRSPSPKSVVAQLDARLNGCIRDYLDSGDFSGALNSTALVRTGGAIQAPRVLLVGLGNPRPSRSTRCVRRVRPRRRRRAA